MRRWLSAVWWLGVAAAATSCGAGFGLHARPGDALERLPVLLVLEGDPLPPGDTQRIADALSARIERPVVVAPIPVLEEAALRRRLAATYGSAPGAGWNAERCAAGRAAAEALAHDANAHYRLVLRHRTVSREATLAEREAASPVRRVSARLLGGFGLADASGMQEARIDGEMIATTFGPEPAAVRLPVEGVAREVATIGGTSLATPEVVRDAVASLRPPPYPHWDALARGLLRRGCRLAALAVYDARLRLRPGSRDVLRAALGPDPSGTGEADAVASTAPPAPTQPPAQLSCKALCELHMVELCNNDRELWSRNHAPWRATPCGQMRDEAFLQECYQRQWVTGTLQDACLQPCEDATDGRARLLHLLQGEGCVRVPPS